MRLNLIDSCGWLEYFADSKNAAFYSPIIALKDSIIVPIICIYEVFKRTLEVRNEANAVAATDFMKSFKVITPSASLAITAAKLSKKYKISMADSFVMATAYEYDADIWTQDSDLKNLPHVHYQPKSK